MSSDRVQLFVPTFVVNDCLAHVRDCLERGWTGMGYKTAEFEERFADWSKLPRGVFLSSCTAALELALECLKAGDGWNDQDEVVTTPITFVSTNHAVIRAGLRPVFADVGDDLCLDPVSVEKRITNRTRAVMFVGIGGNVGRLNEVREICARRNLRLVLDAAHMCGTRWAADGEHVGKGIDAICFSFQAVKNLPTSDAGLLVMQDVALVEQARKRSWCGISRGTFERTREPGTYRWEYDVEFVGHKFNGNSLAASLALAQLPLVDRDNAYRRFLSRRYADRLSGCVRFIDHSPACESSRHLAQIEVLRGAEEHGIGTRGSDRDQVMMYLNSVGIDCGVHYRNNSDYRMYLDQLPCPRAAELSRRIVTLPLHVRMSAADVDRVCRAVAEAVAR